MRRSSRQLVQLPQSIHAVARGRVPLRVHDRQHRAFTAPQVVLVHMRFAHLLLQSERLRRYHGQGGNFNIYRSRHHNNTNPLPHISHVRRVIRRQLNGTMNLVLAYTPQSLLVRILNVGQPDGHLHLLNILALRMLIRVRHIKSNILLFRVNHSSMRVMRVRYHILFQHSLLLNIATHIHVLNEINTDDTVNHALFHTIDHIMPSTLTFLLTSKHRRVIDRSLERRVVQDNNRKQVIHRIFLDFNSTPVVHSRLLMAFHTLLNLTHFLHAVQVVDLVRVRHNNILIRVLTKVIVHEVVQYCGHVHRRAIKDLVRS